MAKTKKKEIPLLPSSTINFLSTSAKPHLELWELLTQVGFGDMELSRVVLSHLRANIHKNDVRMPLLDLGEAKYLSFEGKMFESYKLFNLASHHILLQNQLYSRKIFNEIQALILFVKGGIYSKLSMKDCLHFDNLSGMQLTSIQNLKLAFEYTLAIWRVEAGYTEPRLVMKVAQTLELKGLHTLASIAYRSLGIHFRMKSDFTTAHSMFNKSLQIALEHELKVCRENVLNSIGLCYYHEGNYDLAQETFTSLLIDHRVKEITPFIYENLALIADKQGNYDSALQFVKQALNIGSSLDHVPALPGEALYLGETYEKHFGDLEQAETYYRLGYENSLRYAAAGISLTGDRKKVVEAYVDFLKRVDPPKLGRSTKPATSPFDFAQGKTWKEIRDTFHHELLKYHSQKYRKGKQLAAILEMPATTLYSLRDRLARRGFQLQAPTEPEPDHPLQSFIQDHESLNWAEINQIFEREMVHYLYEKYGYNKLRMSKILKLSYAIIIEKTRDLTRIHENFLPN